MCVCVYMWVYVFDRPVSQWPIKPLFQTVFAGPLYLPAHQPQEEDAHGLVSHLHPQIPVPQDVIVIVTAAKLVPADTPPPDTGSVNSHSEQGRGWQPGKHSHKQELDSDGKGLLILGNGSEHHHIDGVVGEAGNQCCQGDDEHDRKQEVRALVWAGPRAGATMAPSYTLAVGVSLNPELVLRVLGEVGAARVAGGDVLHVIRATHWVVDTGRAGAVGAARC